MQHKKMLMLVVILITATLTLKAQEYKKFRVGLGVGYAMGSGKGAKGGILIDYLEPGYRIQDNILVNLRLNAAAIIRGTATQTNYKLDVAGIGSYSLNGQYYFMDGGFRPYAGLGLGVFSLAAVSVSGDASGNSSTGDVTAAEAKFGFYPRVGFDAGHFTFNIDYNVIPNTKGTNGTEFKNSYIGFRIGGFFGGGMK
jgi:hypothetical protein